jgi:hypothetical protein
MAMQEIDRLVASLFPAHGPKLEDIKFFQGENPVTIEEFCKEVHSAFVQVNSGQSEGKTGFPETLTRVSVDRFLTDN